MDAAKRAPAAGHGFIYMLTSKTSGKKYIGQTVCAMQKRLNNHRSNKKCPLIHNAIVSRGLEDFTVTILHEIPEDELNAAEISAIAEHNAMHPNGYNLHEGGESHKKTPETIAKISATLKGRSKTEEHVKNAAEGRKREAARREAEKSDEQRAEEETERKRRKTESEERAAEYRRKKWEEARATGDMGERNRVQHLNYHKRRVEKLKDTPGQKLDVARTSVEFYSEPRTKEEEREFKEQCKAVTKVARNESRRKAYHEKK